MVVVATALAFGMVGAFGSGSDRPPPCDGDGYNGPGYNGPGYNGPGYNGPGYNGPGPCPPCPPKEGKGKGTGHVEGNSNGQGHDEHGNGNGFGHCKYDRPAAAFASEPKRPTAGAPVRFTATATGSEAIVRYAWDFDDDGEYDDALGQEATHAFAAAGGKRVGLKVTDAVGETATAADTVDVQAPPPPPPPPPAPKPKDDKKPTATAKVVPGQKVADVAKKGLALVVVCSENCQSGVSVSVASKGATKKSSVTLERRLAGGKRTKVRVKLSKKARAALKHRRKAKFRITLSLADDAGNRNTVKRTASIGR